MCACSHILLTCAHVHTYCWHVRMFTHTVGMCAGQGAGSRMVVVLSDAEGFAEELAAAIPLCYEYNSDLIR